MAGVITPSRKGGFAVDVEYRKYRPVWPVYAVALFWVIFTLVHPLYRASDYVTAILLSAVVFIVSKAIWPTMDVPVTEEEETPAEEAESAPQESPAKPMEAKPSEEKPKVPEETKEPAPQPAPEPAAESAPAEAEPGEKVKVGAAAVASFLSRMKPKTKPKAEPEAVSAPEPEPKSEPKPEPKFERKPEPMPELKPEPRPEPEQEPKPVSEPERKPEPKPVPKSEPKPEPKPEPVVEPKPEPKPEPKLEPKPEKKPVPVSPAPDPDAVAAEWKEPEPPVSVPAISPETAALMEEKDRAILAMRRLNQSLRDDTVARQIDQLELSALQIMDRVVADGSLLPQVRKFMIYYLPKTIKLLHGCVKREDPSGARAVLDAMVAAFHRQLNALHRGEVLDITADMARTEAQLARAGLN